MFNGFNISDITAAYFGTQNISEIYLGLQKLWPSGPGPGPTPHDYSRDYLTFEAKQAGTFSFSMNNLQYSLDNGTTWTTLTAGTSTPSLSIGDKILWKAQLTPSIIDPAGIGVFSSTGEFDVMGNIMSLYYGDNYIGQTSLSGKELAFINLFKNNNYLVNANNLVLSATTLSRSCYASMFSGCTSLISTPELPATTLADYCYSLMFYRCTSLTTAPELPATTLATECYSGMFWDCTALTLAPELPSTTLAYYCYKSMFHGCTALTSAPELPATKAVYQCYLSMFSGCTSLTTAPELPATTLAQECYRNMFYGCTSLTVAPELPATTLANSCYDNMFGSCTSLTTAPELLATTLADNCYYQMFYGCSILNYIKCLATDISASDCTFYWLGNTSERGTFVKNTSMTSWRRGWSGIPTVWTIIDA